jgi:YD repeat-containing protein
MDLRRVLVAHRIVLALLAWIAAATPSVAQTLAGTTAGSLTIDQDGSADYTIPVTVPPGAGGMQPDLTLSYDSQSGAGALGQGFTLSGLGQISRCAATLVQDGFIDPVDFDAVQRDRFCLNGKRLIAVTGAYGAVGTRYRTEMESFSEIISAGGTLGDPGYFIERTKSGLTITYGQNTALSTTTNSRFVPPNSGNKALVWGMDSVQDTASNYMTIVYTQNPTGELGEFRPTRINYTGNLRAARLPTNYVQLDWNYVKDVPTITYIGGATTRQGRHISAITTFSNAVQIRKYTFTYTRNTTNGQNYLTSVTECGTGNQCFPPTTFEWTGATGTAHFNGAGTGTWIAHNAGFTKNRIADRDGNGVMDFVALENEGTASARIRNCLSLGTGFDCSTTNPVPQITNFNLVGDYNGDGVTDYGAIENSVQQFNRFFRITGGATYFETEACFQGGNAGDINGDGISDLLGVYHDCTNNFRQYTAFYGSTTGVFTKAHLGSVPTGLVVGTGDFNGDGKTDNMRFSGTSVTVCLNSGASCFSWGGPTIPSGQAPVLGDFNGDGLTDVAAFQSGTTWSICLSTGKAFAACTGVSINSGGSANNTVADFNGDGIADFAQRTSGSTWNTCLGHGGTKFTCQSRTGPSVANSSTAPVDLNGDGLTDLAGFVAGSNWSVGLASEQKPGLLKAVTNGFGSRTDITYAPLSRISTYVKPANLSASVRGIRVPFYVVTRTERNAVTHTASRRAVSYEYEGARVDVAGRGFLGFASRTIRDEMTGKSETTQYRQDFPYVGLPSSMTVKIAGGSTVTSETSLYGLRTFGTGFSTRYFPYPSSSTSSKYEIPPYARLVSSITTSNAYGDDYGNLTASTITTTADGLSYTTTTVNTYINDTLNWLLGRLTRSEVTRTTPTDGPRTRVSSFDYDTLTGLLSGETVEPDSLTLRLNKTYLRDNFGNITTTTVSGSGITPRVSTDTYSADGRFKLTSTNPLLQTESRTFDSGTGNVLTATDLNNLTTTFQYDGLGRLTLQSFNQAGINKTTTTTRALCSQISLCPVTSDYYAITTSESTGQSATVIYDVAERQTAKIVKSPSGNILTRTEYDTEDQVTRMSSPSLSGPTNLYWTQFTYDDLGRVLQENAPIDRNTPTGRITRFEYDGLTVRKFDALNRKTTTVVDALERVVSVTDALNGQVINTYDAFDNLKTVQDAGGAVTSMDYNIRGHKIAMTDPNMGSWTYGYDALGQLLTQQDAKGQIVTMTYDPLGRMLTRIEPEGTTTWVHDTRWRGALTQVDAPGYSRSYTYYGHGGIEQEVTRILAASPPESTSAAITLTVAENVTSALSTVLNWTTSDATSCTAQGTLPGWSGSVDVNGSQVVGLPAEGLYTATLNCVGTLGKSFSRSLEIRVAPRPVVAFDGFEVDRNSVPAGETVSLSWSARNASACVATGDLPGWEGPQPVYGSVTIPQTSAGVFQAGLSCADESDRLASISKAVEIRCQVPLLSCAEGRGAERERHLDTVDFGFLHRPYAPSVIAVPAQADAPRAKVTVQVAVTINGFVEYVTRFNYDTQGRVSQITYPSGFQVAHTYNTAGALEKVFDPAAPATPYWTGQVWDEWGNVSQSRLRNGVDILRDHDAAVARPADRPSNRWSTATTW